MDRCRFWPVISNIGFFTGVKPMNASFGVESFEIEKCADCITYVRNFIDSFFKTFIPPNVLLFKSLN